jgi:hypothetical protein
MPFYRENGYDVALPDDAQIRAVAAGTVRLDAVDPISLRRRFGERLYDPGDFGPGLASLSEMPRILDAVLPVLERWHAAWGFRTVDRYEVRLTLIGPGGSYDPSKGTITLFTTTDGGFKGGGGPPTIVHEIVHIGIESIVSQYGLSHWEKERLVDLICAAHFADLLGGYRLQGRGTKSLDAFVDGSAIEDLPSAIARYVAARRRRTQPRSSD